MEASSSSTTNLNHTIDSIASNLDNLAASIDVLPPFLELAKAASGGQSLAPVLDEHHAVNRDFSCASTRSGFATQIYQHHGTQRY